MDSLIWFYASQVVSVLLTNLSGKYTFVATAEVRFVYSWTTDLTRLHAYCVHIPSPWQAWSVGITRVGYDSAIRGCPDLAFVLCTWQRDGCTGVLGMLRHTHREV